MLASKRKGFDNSTTKLFCHLFIDLPVQQPLMHMKDYIFCLALGWGNNNSFKFLLPFTQPHFPPLNCKDITHCPCVSILLVFWLGKSFESL